MKMKETGSMRFKDHIENGVCIVEGIGHISPEEIQDTKVHLKELMGQDGLRGLVFDCGKTRFLASEVIGLLVALQKKADEIGKKFVLCNLANADQETLKIARLDRFFKVDMDLDEAKAAI